MREIKYRGKRVWVKPHSSKRNEKKLSGKKAEGKTYKVGE